MMNLSLALSKPFSCHLMAGLLVLGLSTPPVRGQGVVINEFFATQTSVGTNLRMAPDEFIEFLITAPTTAAELAALTFGDTHHNTQQMNAAFGFHLPTLEGILAAAGLTQFLPGSLIVVKGQGLGPQELSYNPLSAQLNDDQAWAIQLVEGQGFTQQRRFPGGGPLNLSTQQGDVVWLAQGTPANQRDSSGFIDALGVERNQGRIARDVVDTFGSGAVLNGTSRDGSVAVTRGSGSAAEFAVPTLGQPNPDGASASLIMDLRAQSVPEPSRMLLLGIGLMWALIRRRRCGGLFV